MKSALRLLALFVVLLACVVIAQQPADNCKVTPLAAHQDQANLFSPAQEVDLGELLATSLRNSSYELDEPELSAYLQQVGEELVGRLPPSELKFRFYLSNMPEANAFSIAGGRVFVTRKLVSFLHSEDELAAVLSHELGHIVTHQSALDFSRLLKATGVQEVKDRKDLEGKFHHLLETRTRVSINEQDRQLEADRVGMEVLTLAGYQPKAMADFYDRLTNNKGRTGNWFTELFGNTNPDTKRFREMQKEMDQIPRACIQKRSPDEASGFKKWQQQVVEYSGTGRHEQVPGLISKRAIEPPMQDEVHTLRFSYDGKYLLAQDDATIYVLTRDPLQLKFSIDAPNAYPAQYTLDSKRLTFYTPELRAEVWDLAEQRRAEVHEVVWRNGCLQTALSADAKTLACIDARSTLVLFDTATGETIFEQKEIRQNSNDFFVGLGNVRFSFKVLFLPMGFTPDGRYFLVSRKSGNIAVDVQSHQQIPLDGAARSYMQGGFTFLPDGRLAGNPGSGTSFISKFPGGQVERELDMGSAAPFRITRGERILLRPIRDYAVGVLDLASNQIVRANKTPALDIYDDIIASMMGSGEVALFGSSATPIAKVALPHGHFGTLQSVELSRDQAWLGVSSRSRGAVWNLPAARRVFNLKGYDGGCFGEDGNLYVNFPKQEKLERAIVRLDLQRGGMTLAQKIEAHRSWERCQYLLSLRSEGEKPDDSQDDSESKRDYRYEGKAISWRDLIEGPRENETLEVKDTYTGAVRWTRKFNKAIPGIYTEASNGLMAFRWLVRADGAKAEARDLASVGKNMSSMHDYDYLVELVDVDSGKPVNAMIVSTNDGMVSLRNNMTFNRDWLVVEDTHGRTLVYSWKTGLRTSQFFGKPIIVSREGAMLLVRQGEGRIGVYDLTDPQSTKELVFCYPVSWIDFAADGKVFAISSDQQLYFVDPSLPGQNAASNAR